jgi:hypothetical protein
MAKKYGLRMSATAKTNWFWSDWLGDQAVRRLSPAARGVWIDCLALMATASPVGYLCDDRGRPLNHEEIARVTNAGSSIVVAKLLAEILEVGAASIDRTGRMYNRRMVRDAEVATKRRRNGQLGAAATRLKWQEVSGLPRQNAWQMPRQNGRPPILKEVNITSSETEPRAKASKEGVAEKIHGASLAPTPELLASIKRWKQ